MPYKWDAGFIENLDIVDGRQNDNTLNNLVNAVNGGLDRENLPNNCILPSQIVSQNVAKCTVSRNLYEASTTRADLTTSYWWSGGWNTRGNGICGITYSSMQGGQTNVTAHSENIDCEEGMLSVTWKCQHWINTHATFYQPGGGNPAAGRYSLKNVFWIIKVDGNIVYTSSAYYANWGNVLLECTVPVSKGKHEVRIEFNFANATEQDYSTLYSNTPVYHWWGGTLFTINRLR